MGAIKMRPQMGRGSASVELFQRRTAMRWDTIPSMASTDGFVAPGLEPVREEFERNFAERGDVGASFAVVRDGELVVDLCGGAANSATGRRWEEDTLQVVFSGTKGLVAICLLLLVDRGSWTSTPRSRATGPSSARTTFACETLQLTLRGFPASTNR